MHLRLTGTILVLVSALILSCKSSTTPCDCAKALYDFQIALSESGDNQNEQEKIYEDFMLISERCEQLSEVMGKKAYLEAIAQCENVK